MAYLQTKSNVWWSWNIRCWYILWPFGIFWGHFVSIGIIWLFGIFFPILVCCLKKIWQPWFCQRWLFKFGKHAEKRASLAGFAQSKFSQPKSTYLCMYKYTYVHMYVHTYVHMDVCTYHIHICTYHSIRGSKDWLVINNVPWVCECLKYICCRKYLVIIWSA
jgi:hypothetical protein